MKYYFFVGFVIILGAVSSYWIQSHPISSQTDHYAHKRDIVELETKIRPAYFEDMKWKPPVDIRAPASGKK